MSRPRAVAPEPEILVITGLSGSGKTHVSRALEDIGWFCVDNLPSPLIPRFAELIGGSEELRRAALVVDMREREFPRAFPRVYRQIRRHGVRASLLFLEAEEKVLQRRFSETRRPHPLAVNDPVLEGIRAEREALAPLRKMADSVLDTSGLTVHQLREQVRERYGARSRESRPVLTLVSFGFKYGVPAEADLVLDVRFLPNPNFVPRLRRLTGLYAPVAAFMRRQPDTLEFLRRTQGYLGWLLPRYIREGKSYLTVGVGCTGGRHRSVMVAAALAKALGRRGFEVRLRHRDVKL
jgi:RNase adapter protein RapZ